MGHKHSSQLPITPGFKLKRYNEHRNMADFVVPTVQVRDRGEELIKMIMPFFPKSALIVGAYLTEDDQKWKANYHWDLLRLMCEEALLIERISPENRKMIHSIMARLDANPPSPRRGYAESKKIGLPVDATGEAVFARWETMKNCKRDFGRVVEQERLQTERGKTDRLKLVRQQDIEVLEFLHTPWTERERDKTYWELAYAPILRPGDSNHGQEYALDIKDYLGQLQLVSDISRTLGSSLAFPERSHLHVEFKKNPVVPRGV